MAPRKRLPSKRSNQTVQQSQHSKFGIQHFFERRTQANCTVSSPQNRKSNPSPDANTTESVATAAIAEENSSPISPEITKSVPRKRFKFSPGVLIKQSQDDGGDEIKWKISPVNERLKSLTSKQLPGKSSKIFADHPRPMASGLHPCSGNQNSSCSVGKLEKWISSPITIPTDKSLVSSRKVPTPESEVGNSQESNCERNSLVLEYESPLCTPPSLPYDINQLTADATANGVSDQPATRQHQKISTQIGGEPDIFHENDHPEVLVTYKRRNPKPKESSSDDGVILYDINEVDIDNGFTTNTSSESVSSSKILNKKRTYSQFHLELGQSDFLLHTCSVCGLTYARGNEGDEKVHKTFHKDFYQGIQFKGWHNERVVSGCKSNRDRIVLVLDSDPPTQKYKVEQVVKTMEKELGFGNGILLHELCKVYLFILNQRIVGCLIAEPIKIAHRVVSSSNPCSYDDNCKTITNLVLKPEDAGKDAKRASSSSLQFGNIKFQREIVRKNDPVDRLKLSQWDDGAILCEEEAVPVICGVRAIWVAPSKRRNRVASKLLDAMRKSFCRGYELEISQCAFSSPTSSGKLLATSFSGTKSFLIYKSRVG